MPGLPSNQWLGRVAFGLVVTYCSLFFLQQTNLVISDLGRHLTNGRVVLTAVTTGDWPTFQALISTNFYSYTQPHFPTQMHHWLFGVLAYCLEQTVGFAGLTVFNALVVSVAFALTLWVVRKQAGWTATLTAGCVILPLLTSRTEVRPESISLLLLGAVFWLQHLAAKTKSSPTSLAALGVLSLFLHAVWVNSHIFFALGTGVLSVFWLEHLWIHRAISRPLSALLLGSLLGIFLTPLGISGVLAPFTLFGNYGYLVVENMPLWFMIERFGGPYTWYVAGLFALVVLFTLSRIKLLLRATPSYIALAAIAIIGTILLNRFANVAALLLLPLLAQLVHTTAIKSIWRSVTNHTLGLLAVSLGGTAGVVFLLASQIFFPQVATAGVGITEDSVRSAAFVQAQQVPGPIFNNYDIGSYLIWSLPATERVFVDNRPESYSVSFLQETLVAAQKDEAVWQRVLQQYHFNTIIFYRHDQTPWAQPFLIRRITDAEWEPVFVDNYAIILVRNTPENSELIDKHKLPKDMFTSVPIP